MPLAQQALSYIHGDYIICQPRTLLRVNVGAINNYTKKTG